MALKQRLDDDIKAALLERRRFVAQTLRGLKAAILNEEVATASRDEGLGDSGIEIIVAREIKKRKESISLYEQNGRPELAEDEQKEIDILSVYLPKQLTEQELRDIVAAKVAELGATDIKSMGQVIGSVKDEVGTSGDGALIAKIVKESLV